MFNFQVDRTQYAIGQGGFHHTQVYCWYEKRSFSVVYDCGGSNEQHRKNVIAAFADGKPRKHDWLVISHLDLDHINGIAQLDDYKQTFSNVFLPHLDENKRQQYLEWMAIVALANGRDANQVQEGLTIVQGLYRGDYGQPVMMTHSVIDGADNDQQPASIALSLPATTQEVLRTAKKGTTLGDSASFSLAEIDWQFRFYSREWNNLKVNAIWKLPVLSALRKIVTRMSQKGSLGVPSWKAELETVLDGLVNQAECSRALSAIKAGKKASGQMSLKKLISALYKLTEIENYNSASLCLYSGPRERGSNHPRFNFSRQIHGLPSGQKPRLEAVQMTRSVGWLGTGDLHFPNQAVVTEFSNHFLTELSRVSTVVVPHHGSKDNYAADDISPLLSLMMCFSLGVRLFIVPAKRSVYGHPHEEVEHALSRNDVLQIVNESALTQINESIATAWFKPAA